MTTNLHETCKILGNTFGQLTPSDRKSMRVECQLITTFNMLVSRPLETCHY